MATYGYSYTNTSVTIEVYGLAIGDSVRFFVRRDPNPDGAMLVDGETFTSTSSTMAKSFFVLSAGNRYAINVYVNGVVLGAQYFSTSNGQVTPVRPDNWYWSGIEKDKPILLSASSWNQFCERINEFRRYKGLSAYSFETVRSGGQMYAYQANQAVIAINEMNNILSYVWPGDTMSESFMKQLQNTLNAVV